VGRKNNVLAATFQRNVWCNTPMKIQARSVPLERHETLVLQTTYQMSRWDNKDICNLLISDPAVEVCDATDDDSSTAAG